MSVYDAEYRRMAKAANQRLVTFERKGMYSPAVLQVKAQLSAVGRRRFTETGKASSREALKQEMKILNKFLYEDKTSTAAGYKEYRKGILESSEEKYQYREYGISDEDWLKMWESLPDKKGERGRKFGSDVYIAVLENARKKNPDLDVEQLMKDFEQAKDYKSAVKAVGLNVRDVNRTLRGYAKQG